MKIYCMKNIKLFSNAFPYYKIKLFKNFGDIYRILINNLINIITFYFYYLWEENNQ